MAIRTCKRKRKTRTTWTAVISVKGVTEPRKPFTRAGFPTRDLAEQYARAREREFLESLQGAPRIKTIGFEELAAEYLELCEQNNSPRYFGSKKSSVSRGLLPFLSDRRPTDIRPADIEAYVAKRSKELAQKTVLNEFIVLNHMLNQAVK